MCRLQSLKRPDKYAIPFPFGNEKIKKDSANKLSKYNNAFQCRYISCIGVKFQLSLRETGGVITELLEVAKPKFSVWPHSTFCDNSTSSFTSKPILCQNVLQIYGSNKVLQVRRLKC